MAGRKAFFYAPALLLLLWPLALWVCMCVHACWEEKNSWRVNGDVTVRRGPPRESASEWPYLQPVCVVRESVSGLPFPLHKFLRPQFAQRGRSLYFILFARGRSFHLPHTCFSSDVCLFSPMMCFAMEASHLTDIGTRSEGLLKQTQYP